MDIKQTETHPLQPFLPARAQILLLGTFPPPRARWSMEFYYPNLQNDMWRIFGLIFFHNKSHFLTPNQKAFDADNLRHFLTEKRIALSDTAQEIIREQGNASDKHLNIIRKIDLHHLLQQIPECHTIVATGQKAMDTLLEIIPVEQPRMGSAVHATAGQRTLHLYRMPSSSRAYPKPLEEKALLYQNMLQRSGIITPDPL